MLILIFLCFSILVSRSSVLFLSFFAIHIQALEESRYIDDQDGDSVTGIVPIYTPSTYWQQGASCVLCGFDPDPSKTFHGTWHDITHETTDPPATVEFGFTGITLDVYCLLPNFEFEGGLFEDYTSSYNLSFVLDGQPVGQIFTHKSDLSGDIRYNVSVLSLSNLAPVPHTFAMIGASTVDRLTIQFDYAKYTFDNDTQLSTTSSAASSRTTSTVFSASVPSTLRPSDIPSATTTTSAVTSSVQQQNINRAAIIGGSIGGILALLLLIVIIFVYRRYKHRIRRRFYNPQRDIERIDPFYSPPPPSVAPMERLPMKRALWRTSNIVKSAPIEIKRAGRRLDE
ncbi:hypothetical protein GGU10DRAFT_300898 [Lentinula aff. detonsa]|uniref:Uncharacterized protein n=1 Tax=Lentinula aff. detonsa TaxID=2804958 RepID=A0AA38NHG8_9AGAR|nr:hypothetical protein GGU10DRAFT_300898 [Lentinula aff. detonsa]